MEKQESTKLAAMSISVMNSSIHKKEAVDFAFYVTNSENQIAFSKIETTSSINHVALNDPFFTLDDGTLETKARIIGAKELFDAVRLRKYLEHPQFDKLRDAFDEAVQKACLGNATTKEALDEAAQKWNTILGVNDFIVIHNENQISIFFSSAGNFIFICFLSFTDHSSFLLQLTQL
ncbi:MAG: hypothetical protein MZV64_14980 [Ignavibacteriales bacterium]|nr:hypothetical protein [Ignavibacteriales bacterium]